MRYHINKSSRFLLVFAIGMGALAVRAQEPSPVPYPRISEEGYKARLPFFDYDKDIPLEARIVQQWDKEMIKQKIVFRGVQGLLVPGLIEFPAKATKPYPLVLLLHGWSGNKDNWYEEGGYISGGEMRKALLEAGYAVLALDACAHGERSNEIAYMHVNMFDDPKAEKRKNFFTFSDICIQTIRDYRRVLDYVATCEEIDMSRIGILGYSMGAMNAIMLLAFEPRIKMAVACVPTLAGLDKGPTAPVDYTWGIGQKPLLMLMGKKDELYKEPEADAAYHAYIEGPNTRIIWYDQGHKLTNIYVPDALDWVKNRL